jgi:hypothetical protein
MRERSECPTSGSGVIPHGFHPERPQLRIESARRRRQRLSIIGHDIRAFTRERAVLPPGFGANRVPVRACRLAAIWTAARVARLSCRRPRGQAARARTRSDVCLRAPADRALVLEPAALRRHDRVGHSIAGARSATPARTRVHRGRVLEEGRSRSAHDRIAHARQGRSCTSRWRRSGTGFASTIASASESRRWDSPPPLIVPARGYEPRSARSSSMLRFAVSVGVKRLPSCSTR